MDRQIRIALGVTGCIAAYKAVEVLRGLQKAGADVQVVMTLNATRFVTPLTFQAISGQPVITGMFADTSDPEIKHIQLAGSIDLLLVAPATANALAKFAAGIADDFLSTLYISTRAPMLVAPAMNVEMWLHPATRVNVQRLKERGVCFVDPDEGYLACRTVGPGRLAESASIVSRALELIESSNQRSANSDPKGLPGSNPASLADIRERRRAGPAVGDADASAGVVGIKRAGDLSGHHILVTAGPTYEPVDPVRGLTNRSSGRMGYAVAEAAVSRGARVTLVTGPVAIEPPAGAEVISVLTAGEMHRAVMAALPDATIVVMAAAVADYRPAAPAARKIKKNEGGGLTISLEATEDILKSVGAVKGNRTLVGFAAETESVIENARRKLADKNADMIVANDISREGAGFDVETNIVSLVSREGVTDLPLMTKRDAADFILDEAAVLSDKQAGVSRQQSAVSDHGSATSS